MKCLETKLLFLILVYTVNYQCKIKFANKGILIMIICFISVSDVTNIAQILYICVFCVRREDVRNRWQRDAKVE